MRSTKPEDRAIEEEAEERWASRLEDEWGTDEAEAPQAADEVRPEVFEERVLPRAQESVEVPCLPVPSDAYRVYVAGAVIADRSPGPAGMGVVMVRGPERVTHHAALGFMDAHVAVVRAASWVLDRLIAATAPIVVYTNHPGLVKALKPAKVRPAPVVRDLFGGAVGSSEAKRVTTPYGAALVKLSVQLTVRSIAGVVLSPNKIGDPEMVVARSLAALGAELANDQITQDVVARTLARSRKDF